MSGTKTFLLELHCEEIPARFLEPLADELADKVEDALESWIPTGDSANYGIKIQKFYSPRKLAWRAQGLPIAQPDQTDTQVGPPQRMCVGEDGKPTLQGLKFAEKWGVDFSAVRFEQPAGKKEPCAVVTLMKRGRPTVDLLAEALPGLIAGLHVPKAMRWGSSEFEFVRPIRNILCLFGDQVVPITVDGVRATNTTWGHRLYHREHPAPVAIATPEAYESALEAAGVVVSVEARRTRIAQQLEALAAEVEGRVVADAELLDTLAEIVEFPKIVRGEFPADFLELPKEVLVTSLREHQKSFCIEGPDGALLPFFLTAANRTDDPAGFVKAGNEWVLKARLYDAHFFFAEDRKHSIETRVSSLEQLVFQREIGSYLEKSLRISDLARKLSLKVGLDPDKAASAGRLCKFDLRSLMVNEFPELQGIMGGEYLRLAGAPTEVWKAVKEHYRPIGPEDSIPDSDLGCLISLADKSDTVIGCLKNGMYPTGSKDPLALRRFTLGVIRIIWEKNWNIDFKSLISIAYSLVPMKGNVFAIIPPIPQEEGAPLSKPRWFDGPIEAIEAFFKDRVAYQLEVAGYAGSVRRSALAAGWEDLADLKARCEALSAFAEDPRFASLAQSAKRIGNILKDEIASGDFDRGLLTQAEEKVLAERLGKLETTADRKALLEALADLAEPLEAFFAAVMVKCEDPALRAARLSLLHRLRQAFLRVADFSLWQ